MERITVSEKTIDQAKENYDPPAAAYGRRPALEITDVSALHNAQPITYRPLRL
jgi:hypothetical protein